MSLANLLELNERKNNQKIGISQERLRECLPELRKAIAFYREYPDLLVDVMKGPNSTFNFYFYQRVFLRTAMRHKNAYAVYPRAYSKSFLAIMILMLRCILYPNAHLFITTGGKEQAASIARSKVEEICKLIPAFKNEIDWRRGQSKSSKDEVVYIFKNGSQLDIMAARQSSRGQRRTGGEIEESILVEKETITEVIIPTMNVDRLLPNGLRDPNDNSNKSLIWVTTAGWKNSYAYDKLIETLIGAVLEPKDNAILGGTYRVPQAAGLLSEDFVDELRLDGTFNDSSFDREYNSIWCGDAENAFFSSEVFDRSRVLNQPEKEFSGRSSKSAYYVLGVDVGRIGCTTEVMVFKVTPQAQGAAVKSLVNLYSFEAEHFEEQAINIKKLYNKYKARQVAIDANGLGVGLIDFMVKSQTDPETGDFLPDFGVSNDDEGLYRKFRTEDTEMDAMFLIKANAPINTEAYSYAQTQLLNNKIKFLKDEQEAKVKLMSSKVGQQMTPLQRAEELRPFTLTTILKEEMMNLVEENEGVNIILKQSTRSIKKDKFSAFIYGLYYIKQEEDRKKKRRSHKLSDYMRFN